MHKLSLTFISLIKKPMKGFIELTYFEKSQLITSWVQIIFIIFGFTFTYLQLSISDQTFINTKVEKSLELINSHEKEYSKSHHKMISYYNDKLEFENDKNKVNLFNKKYETYNREEIFNEYIDSLQEMKKCAIGKICEEEMIYNYLCFEVKNLLVVVKKIESYEKQRLTMEFNDACPIFDRMIYQHDGSL